MSVQTGGPGADSISGTNGQDILSGLAGNDTITGRFDADEVRGNRDDDNLRGGEGSDVVRGNRGDDDVSGGFGNDTVAGGTGDDSLRGGTGDDKVRGGDGNDTISGGQGNDRIVAGEGDDLINGGLGDDLIFGGSGTDTIIMRGSADKSTIEFGSDGKGNFIIVTGPGGVDKIYDAEFLQFVDQIVVMCFYPGTMIRTPAGEVAVEALKAGDLVLTAEGKAVPVRFMFRHSVSTRFGDPLRVLPIRVKAGALGENLPVRDLLLSPSHALMIEGTLVQAGALVNGSTILREQDVPESFTYFHAELAGHDLVLAEGVAAETFVDSSDREHFDNWDEYQALVAGAAPVAEMDLPRAKSARQVPAAVRALIEARAEALLGKAAAAA